MLLTGTAGFSLGRLLIPLPLIVLLLANAFPLKCRRTVLVVVTGGEGPALVVGGAVVGAVRHR